MGSIKGCGEPSGNSSDEPSDDRAGQPSDDRAGQPSGNSSGEPSDDRAGQPSTTASETPSWPRVIGTTVRLWAQRRARWLRQHMTARRWQVAVVVAVVIAVLAAVGVAVGQAGPGPDGPAHKDASDDLGTAAAARVQAAVWIAQQVSRSAIVACDPVMCSVLTAHGIPAANLLQLGPSAGDPLGSTVVVATAAVRSQFGPRLADVYAPEVLASFGSGAGRVQVLVTAPDGAAAYAAALRADLAERQQAGLLLLRNRNVSASARASRELAAGVVDSRLLITLATLAARRRVRVIAFGDSGPGASPGIPLRSAELASPLLAVGRTRSYLQWVLSFVRAQRVPYRVAAAKIGLLATGQMVLRIEFAAPSPLGLLGTANDLASERR
jgi:hypothetical protein